jgi:trk system potassium uptake protein TrkA
MVIQSDGNSLTTLEEAGIANANALIALTDSDEVNMITCSFVDAVYPDILKIARVRNYEYYVNTRETLNKHADAFQQGRPLYGIDAMVHPDVEAAEAIIRAVEYGAAANVLVFTDSDYVMTRVTVEAGSRLDGAKVMDVRQITDKECLISYIEVDDDAKLPSGPTEIHAGYVLGILTREEHIPHFLELAGSQVRKFNKIALIGAGRIGTLIAESLIHHTKKSLFSRFFSVRSALSRQFVIIDKNDERARAASERFPDANVFRADVTDEGFLAEEGIAGFDLVICATHNHELNIVVSGYLKSLGVGKTITLVGSEEFAQIARNIGTDAAIPLKDAVVDTILGHLRGKSVTGIHTISDGDLEIIEYELQDGAQVLGKALKDIAAPGVFLVLQVKKKNTKTYVIPDGNTVLDAGDEVVLITYAEGNEKVLERFG